MTESSITNIKKISKVKQVFCLLMVLVHMHLMAESMERVMETLKFLIKLLHKIIHVESVSEVMVMAAIMEPFKLILPYIVIFFPFLGIGKHLIG